MKQELPGRKGGSQAASSLVLAVLLGLAAIGGIYWWVTRPAVDETTKYWFDKAGPERQPGGKSPEDIQGMLDAIVEEGMFNVSVNARVVFEDSKASGPWGWKISAPTVITAGLPLDPPG